MSVAAPILESADWFTGEVKNLVFTVLKDDGSAADMTGWAMTWTFLNGRGDAVVLSKTVGAGITILGVGSCQVQVVAADTAALSATHGWHELRRTNAGFEALLSYGEAVLQV